MTRKIAVTNETTCLSDAQIIPMVAACQVQIVRDLVPAWALSDPDIVLGFVPKGETPPPDAELAAMLDTSDQAGALGYHDLTAQFRPLCKIFAADDIRDGSLVSVTLSHELCEMIVDPHLENSVRSADGQRFYLKEVGDAVEADGLGYPIDGVQVSDFTYPAFWDAGAAPGSKLDHMGHATAPFQILPGGYLAYYEVGKGWVQDFNGQHRNMGPRYAAKSRFALAQVARSQRRPSTRWHLELG